MKKNTGLKWRKAMAECYILYGAGKNGKEAIEFFHRENILAVVDQKVTAPYQDEGGVHYFPVGQLKKIKEENPSAQVVVTTTIAKYVAEISATLGRQGIDFCLLNDAAEDIIQAEGNRYNAMNPPADLRYVEKDEYLFPLDRVESAGSIHSYFWQDLWAAEKILKRRPEVHYDIGSRIDGFIAHLSAAGQRTNLIDIRPFDISIPCVEFTQSDATNLDAIEDESIESLSALCSLEHFGLGRYGDPLDPDACFKCFRAIQRKMKKGGRVYISVPIGRQHLEFNAHRIFNPQTIVDSFSDMQLVEFSECKNEEFERNADMKKYAEFDEHGGDRFGLFEFVK